MPIASVAKIKGSSCQQESSSEGDKRTTIAGPELPEDIWYHIHSLLPLRDAARAIRVCHAFLCSWKCHPNLTFSKSTMGLNSRRLTLNTKKSRIFIDRVDQIMINHSGIGVKRFKLDYDGSYFDTSKLTSWLQIAVTPGIEELEISVCLPREQEHYNFPCSLLSAGSGGNSIQGLSLRCCAFRPMAGLGCLTRLHLSVVHITGDELGCLLSGSFALEGLDVKYCREIICLKIPCLLHRLSKLTVSVCETPTVIENKAPNLCTVSINSDILHLSIGDSLQVKCLKMFCLDEFSLVHHARAKLPANMPNLETLRIYSIDVQHTMCTWQVPPPQALGHLSRKFNKSFCLFPDYDYFSLVFFLDACPILETFMLEVKQTRMKHDSVEDSSQLRQMPGHRHDNIKKVEIIGFCSAKSMVELTCHILENATSLECLTLDTALYDYDNYSCEEAYRLSDHKFGKCAWISKRMIKEAHKALLAIERYVVVKVPSTVKLNVMKPCSRCHVLKSCQPNVRATTIV